MIEIRHVTQNGAILAEDLDWNLGTIENQSMAVIQVTRVQRGKRIIQTIHKQSYLLTYSMFSYWQTNFVRADGPVVTGRPVHERDPPLSSDFLRDTRLLPPA